MLTQDPIGLAGGVNLYAYAGNNPIAYSDPFGLCPWCVGASLGAAVFGAVQVAANIAGGRPATENLGQSLLLGAVAGGTFGAAAPEATMAFAAKVGGLLAAGGTAATAGAGAAQGLGKLPVPQVPAGMSRADFGQRVIGWGGNSAEAIARIGTEKLREAGVTVQMAQRWADFYANEMVRNASNPSAAGRAELMNHVVDILKQ